jgi:hypothetical protein
MMEIGGVGQVPTDLGVRVSKTMFAPRAGLAYRATDSFVIRAGYGMTNDPYALARPLRTNHPILIELDVRAPNGWSEAGRLSEGIPPIPVPSLGDGIVPIPNNVTAFTIPLDFDRGYIQSWNLTFEREFRPGLKGEIGYVATRQTRQLGFRELNYAPIGGGAANQILNRQFGRTANTRLITPIGDTRYDSLQARLQRHFSGWYSFEAAYTWGKSITTSGTNNSDSVLPINIPEFYHLNRSLSGFDRTHNLQVTNITYLPFGRGRQLLADRGALTAIASGWQISNVISFMSGQPFSIGSSAASLNAPGNSQRADRVKETLEKPGGIGAGQPWFDPTAFAPVNEARFGTAGFNSVRGPGVANWDLGLHRSFQLRGEMTLQLRAEAFNVTNTPKFNNPRSTAGSSGFGEIFSSFGEREMRLGLRLGF